MDSSRAAGIVMFIIVVLIAGGAVAYAAYHRPIAVHAPGTAVSPPLDAAGSASGSAASAASTSPATTTPGWEQGFQIVTTQDNGKMITLAAHERFIIQLGSSLKWTLSFDPASGITRVPNTTTENGIQGIYEAEMPGIVTMHATGAPICAAGQACPQFLAEETVTFTIK